MNKVREENIPVINYVSEVRDGDISDNQDVLRWLIYLHNQTICIISPELPLMNFLIFQIML